MSLEADLGWMRVAMSLANYAGSIDEIPVGAIIVRQGQIVSTAFNKRETNQDATAHAEILAIASACRRLGAWRLCDCEIYVTLEPCLMCSAAAIQARIKRCIFATKDPKGGALGSIYDFSKDPRLHHTMLCDQGILEQESALLLHNFFKNLRSSRQLLKK